MKTIYFILLSVLFTLLFTACNCEDDNVPDCQAIDPPSGCVCYEIYAPVCGCNGETYVNDCYAECHGIFDYEEGACED